MAKQTSLIKINGKADGQSFYTSKNGGALMRSINKGMGQRVKESQEYLNTRKNNAEFGACGDFAGVFIGTITQRWRFILTSIATGLMVKAAKAAIVSATVGNWGQRAIPVARYGDLFTAFNGLSKNAMPEVIQNAMKNVIKFDASTNDIFVGSDIEVDMELLALLENIKADGFTLDFYHHMVDMPTWDGNTNTYFKSNATLTHLSGLHADVSSPTVNSVILPEGNENVDTTYANDDTAQLDCCFVIFRPYRTVNGEKSILQQHCAGAVFVPGVGTKPEP